MPILDLRIKFKVNVKYRLTTRVRGFYNILSHLLFYSDIREKLWVGLGLGVVKVPLSLKTCSIIT